MKRLGITLLERNVRAAGGELDLVGLEGRTIVIVEVKSRSSDAFGTPQEAVDARKRMNVIRATRAFLKGKGLLDRPRRYDLASVRLDGKGRPVSVTWTKGAFDEEGR